MVRFLLRNGADPNGSTRSGPIICRAASGDNPEMLKAFIEHHADVNAVDCTGQTPLHCIGYHASRHTRRDFDQAPLVTMAKMLIEAGADINARTEKETMTPLHEHIRCRQLEVVKVLLDAKADLEIKTGKWWPSGGFSPLAFAAWRDAAAAARLLLDAGADPNSKSWQKGGAALHLSVDETVVRTLLDFDPDLSLENDEGDTPLNALLSLTSADKQDEFLVEGIDDLDAPAIGVALPVIELLLARGSDVNHPNKAGQTPLFKALAKPDLAIARLLLSKGANPHHISRDEGMPLHSACRHGTFEAVQLILDAAGFAEEAFAVIGTPANAACTRGDDATTLRILQHLHDRVGLDRMGLNQRCGAYGSALSAACFWGSASVVAWLLEHGARVRIRDGAERSPILFAAYRNVAIFSQILEAGGDVAARDAVGRSVLHVAVQSGEPALVGLVLEMDPSLLTARDRDGWAPLHYAVRGCRNWLSFVRKQPENQADIVKLLLDDGVCAARDFVVHGHEDERWSILKLAHYRGAVPAVHAMLEKSLKKQQGANWDPWSEVIEKANWNSYQCDYCLMGVRGLRYHCKQCVQFNLCYKCYGRKEAVHPGHQWDTIGEEFMEDQESYFEDQDTDEGMEANESSDRDSEGDVAMTEDSTEDSSSCDSSEDEL